MKSKLKKKKKVKAPYSSWGCSHCKAVFKITRHTARQASDVANVWFRNYKALKETTGSNCSRESEYGAFHQTTDRPLENMVGRGQKV